MQNFVFFFFLRMNSVYVVLHAKLKIQEFGLIIFIKD